MTFQRGINVLIALIGILSSTQITDSYLLALAHSRSGQLATFDQRLVTAAVRNQKQTLHLMGS